MVVDELLPDQLDHAQHMLGQEEGDLGEDNCTLVTCNGVLLGPLLAVEVPMTLGGEELRGGVEEGRGGEGRRKGARVGKGGKGKGWVGRSREGRGGGGKGRGVEKQMCDQRPTLHSEEATAVDLQTCSDQLSAHHCVTGVGGCRSVWVTRRGGAV